MAAHDDSYTHGAMDITDQADTYKGFMVWAQWGSLLVAMSVLFLTLVFGMGLPWMACLFGAAALGVIAGLVMNMGAAWYVTVIVSTIASLVVGGIVTLIGNFL
jgi:Bacterial aa3 type cytochrome c oxidase subunit IV